MSYEHTWKKVIIAKVTSGPNRIGYSYLEPPNTNHKEQVSSANKTRADSDSEMNQQCPGDDGEGDENSQPHPTRVRLSLTEEMEREAESQLKRDLDWAGIRGIIQSHGDNEIVESSGSDDELEVEWEENENIKVDEDDPTKLCRVNNIENKKQKHQIIADYIEAYDPDDEITLMGDEDIEEYPPPSSPLADQFFVPASRPGSSKSMSRHDNSEWRPIRKPLNNLSYEQLKYRSSNQQLEEIKADFWDENGVDIPVEMNDNGTTGAVIAGRSRKRDLPSPILRDQLDVGQSIVEAQAYVQTSEQRASWILQQQAQTPYVDDTVFQDEVLLVPGVNECTVGNMEAILDSMKNCCGSSQQFRMVESLEIALRKCRPGCRIFVGCGEHPISSFGVIGNSGGQISGPHAGYGQAVISPTTADHVWLNVMRCSEVSMENVTILLDKVNFSSTGAGDFLTSGPGVGLLVQGGLRLHNVIITTKLNDNAENPSRPITAIELTERASLHLQRSTIKFCSIGLVVQNDADTEIYEATITNCVIGMQSALLGKNYIQDVVILHSNNYAIMLDSETQLGEGSVENLKNEESFFIENIKIKDCSTEVYFVGVEPQSSSSGSDHDQSGGSLNNTK